MKKLFIVLAVLIVVGVGAYLFTRESANPSPSTPTATTTPVDTATTTVVDERQTVIGKSAGGRDIVAYHYGAATGTEVLLVGGIHGGYSWNTALVAYEAMAHLESDSDAVPSGVRVTVIPVLNPDGLAKVVTATGTFSASDIDATEAERVAARFNGNNVDLNRNFDCDWQAEGTWQTRKVDGGDAAFSEPESQAVKSYVESRDIAAAIVWYSSAGGVFASNCHDGVLDETKEILATFSRASGYTAHEEFNFYEVTGDLTNWLAKRGTPAISVLLTDHTGTEWSKNRAGIDAVLASFE
jgi:murein tripeptide amidase MpaA